MRIMSEEGRVEEGLCKGVAWTWCTADMYMYIAFTPPFLRVLPTSQLLRLSHSYICQSNYHAALWTKHLFISVPSRPLREKEEGSTLVVGVASNTHAALGSSVGHVERRYIFVHH